MKTVFELLVSIVNGEGAGALLQKLQIQILWTISIKISFSACYILRCAQIFRGNILKSKFIQSF